MTKASEKPLTPSQIALFEKLLIALEKVSPGERNRRLARLPAGDAAVAELVRLAFSEPPSFRSLKSGDTLGGYVLVKPLGAGGCGVVWKAEHSVGRNKVPVAIKLIRPHHLQGAHAGEYRRRFQDEIELLVKLTKDVSEGIAKIISAGEAMLPGGDQAVDFLVMEFVAGNPVTEVLHPFSIGKKVRCLAQIARAVQRAHNAGILHLDLKPANVLVVEKGGELIPRVLDFGLARVFNSGQPFDIARFGEGTLRYQAPEQLQPGVGPDFRTDVHALGVLCFEALTRRLPHEVPDGDFEKLTKMILNGPRLKLRAIDAQLSVDLAGIVEQAMSILPAKRHAKAGDLADALEAWAAENERPAGPKKRPSSSRVSIHVEKNVGGAVGVFKGPITINNQR